MNIALFFTRGVSLLDWENGGILDREVAIYNKYLEMKLAKKIFFFTYGSKDLEIANRAKRNGVINKDITIHEIPKILNTKIGKIIYSFVIPLVNYHELKNVTVFKSNQIDGSWVPLLCKWLFKKPFYLRTGYTLSLLRKKQKHSRWKISIIELVERIVFNCADISSVTSESQKDYIETMYGIDGVKVLPNYVDINIFKKVEIQHKYKDRVIFVGRISKEKNLVNIVDSICESNWGIDIYGDGDFKKELLEHIKGKGYENVKLHGVVKNVELPIILNMYNYFILASISEGMPKSLVEAMACELVCIGTNVEGINNILIDGKNGFLAEETSKESIKNVIKKIQSSSDLSNIQKNARKTIIENYTLENIVQTEYRLIKSMEC